MEPLPPMLREMLKQAHTGLTDDEIDQLENLRAQRFLLDPEQDADQIRALDRSITELIQQKMPFYREVAATVAAAAAARVQPRSVPQVEIKRRSNANS